MATINLGAIKFNWKGAYNNGTAYAVDDVVSSGGSSYVCILASTGNATSNGTYWEQMSSAGTNGTNGTDLTSTLTTQGDILYRDGSGLQRLGAGTSGQVLQTGGTGANPSWGTVSSDYVKLASTTVNVSGNTVTQVIHDSIFNDSTYHSYKIFINNYQGNATNANLYMRFRASGSNVTADGYDDILRDGYKTIQVGDFQPGGSSGTTNADRFDLSVNWTESTENADEAFNAELNLSGTNRTDVPPMLNGTNSRSTGGSTRYLVTGMYAGIYAPSTPVAVDGIQIFTSEYIRTLNLAVYGLKK